MKCCCSHVICCYLADKYGSEGNDALYPKEPAQWLLVDEHLYYDCGNCGAGDPFWCWANTRGTDYLHERLENCLAMADYLAGDKMTIADLCTVATVSTSSAFASIAAELNPKLTQWLKRMQALPYYQDSNQEALDMLITLVKGLLAERQT